MIVETAWHYRHQNGISDNLRRRLRNVPAPACKIAWNAQQRLNKRYHHLLAHARTGHQTVVAICRELLGFIWAIATTMKTHAWTGLPMSVRSRSMRDGSEPRSNDFSHILRCLR